jgi:transcriptional regulator with XRE-family HTH domain
MRNDIYLKEMGKKIKAMRKAQKITLDRMANLCGINVTAISFLENGKSNPHLLTLKSIADVLGVNIKDFL